LSSIVEYIPACGRAWCCMDPGSHGSRSVFKANGFKFKFKFKFKSFLM
jgi:hypothetical protein